MTTWRYRAARLDGHVIRGIVDAPTRREATGSLLRQGLSPLALEEGGSAHRVRMAPPRDLALLFRGFASLFHAGLPLAKVLAAAEGMSGPRFLPLLRTARERLAEGDPFSIAIGGVASPVPPRTIALLRAGERAGRLGEALEEIASALEAEASLRAQLVQALAYPAMLTIGGLVSIAVVGLVVVPRFAAMLAEFGQALPPATAALLTVTSWVADWWPQGLAVAALLAGVVASLLRRPHLRARCHELLLEAPAIGAIRARLGAARLLRALAGALAAGMPLPGALALAADASGDLAIRQRTLRALALVEQGTPLTTALKRHRVLPEAATHLLGIGEGSGRLAEMARNAGNLLASEAERALQSLVRLIEPGLIIVLGGGVALVAGALLQAVYGLRPS
jgi:general secretion pathway protein F